MFAHLFGIRPWEMRRLTAPQYHRLRRFAEEMVRAQTGG